MHILRNKTNAIVIIALMLLSNLAFALVALPPVKAENSTKTTYPFVVPWPNPVGVGQTLKLWVGITDMVNEGTTSGPSDGWQGITVTVTKPDNTTETLGPIKTDTTGGTEVFYTPTMIGTYKFQTNFPQQVAPLMTRTYPANTTMLASSSSIETVNVVQEQVSSYPNLPLPAEYWTNPVNDQLRGWTSINSNYLRYQSTTANVGDQTQYMPNSVAPNSPHILWRSQNVMGGIAGGQGNLNDIAYSDGSAYEGQWTGFIISGIFYHNVPWPSQSAYQGTYAVDLRTGEQLWFNNNTRISFGQVMYWNTPNQMAAFAYLWDTDPGRTGSAVASNINAKTDTSTWKAYDAYTGVWWYTMTNVPSGNMVYGPNGEILIYTVNVKAGWMTLWNSSNIPALYGASDPTNSATYPYNWMSWRPYGKIVNATGPFPILPQTKNTLPTGYAGYMWNISIPKGLNGDVIKIRDDVMLGTNDLTYSTIVDPINYWALNLKPGQEGQLLFNVSYATPPGNATVFIRDASAEDNVFVTASRETRQLTCYSMSTGSQLWQTAPQDTLDWVGFAQTNWVDMIAYHKLYSGQYSGILHCYDITTGKLLWTYTNKDPYMESVLGPNFMFGLEAIADGKVYLQYFEHSYMNPKPRGGPLVCLNATTGAVIWDIAMSGPSYRDQLAILGDSILVNMNAYDQNYYAMGKGPSAMTVTAPDISQPLGTSVQIRGTVMDISAGTKEPGLAARFPNGVAAVSEASMTDWMSYLYFQFPRPTNATGVPVTLSVVDANGNYREIGTTTSNDDGFFSFNWKPDIEGKYTIYASFGGSESYWPSHAVTSFAVDPAAASPAPTEALQLNLVTSTNLLMYLAVGVIAIIIAIAIVGLLLLRKRP